MSDDLARRIEEMSIPVPETGCWLWLGNTDQKGYGRIQINGRSRIATRMAFAAFHKPIPDGMLVLHKCDTPRCCNPNHLFLGTAKENTLDMLSKGRHRSQQQTHCKNGHEFTPENIQYRSNKPGWRLCKTCHRQSAARYDEKKRQRKIAAQKDKP